MIGPGLDVPGGMTAVHRTWLKADAMKGIEVDYFETMGEGSFLTKLGKNVAGEAKFLSRLAAGYRPDVFHIHVADRRSFYRKLAYFEQAQLTGKPVVVHIHGAVFEAFHDASPANAKAIRWMFKRAALVLVLHHRILEKAVDWVGDEARIEILYNPVDLRPFDEGDVSDPARPPTVLMMGEIGERKGAFDLLSAIPAILERVPNARFRFAGNGETERLASEAAALGVADQVDVLGWVSGAAKVQAFMDADVYCLPSYAENLPVSVLEAMAARLPVVSTPVAGTPEAVIEGETGFLVAPGDRDGFADRLSELLSDGALRASMAQAGRARAEAHFDNEVVVERLVSLWRSTFDETACA
jgi:glycosyltransferase involved in cell wall biosynthesis